MINLVCSECHETLGVFNVSVLKDKAGNDKITLEVDPCMKCDFVTKMTTPEMPTAAKYEEAMNRLRRLVCEPKMGGEQLYRMEGWDAAARKAWHFFERHLRRKP